MLCGGQYEHRKAWIQQRLLLLSQHCAIGIAAYAVMSNHLHVVAIPRPQLVQTWPDDQVIRSALTVSRRLGPDGNPTGDVSDAAVAAKRENPKFIAAWRQRLGNVSDFMRFLNEPLARLANQEDGVTGHFWEGRFKSIPLLDQAALFTCMAYVDLNPVRACLANTLETADFTSIQDRMLAAVAAESDLTRRAKAERERLEQAQSQATCLLPIAACTGDAGNRHDWPTITEDDYLHLVKTTGQCIHPTKPGFLNQEKPSLTQQSEPALLKRLNLNPDEWLHTMRTPHALKDRVLGRTSSLLQEAQRIGATWIQATCSLFTARPRHLSA